METLITALCDLDAEDVVALAAITAFVSVILLWAGIIGGLI